MPHGIKVGLCPGDVVLDGDQLHPERCKAQFSAHVYCGQTARWMKMPLSTEVAISPGHIVLDGEPAPYEKGTVASPL